VSWDLPGARHGVAKAILGGWSVDGLVIAGSAAPVNVVGASITVANTQFQPRPNIVAGAPLYLFGAQYPGGKALNAAAFSAAAGGQHGNFGRNVLRGFGLVQLDLTLRRQFHLTERSRLQLRAECFNVLNHPNFGAPIGSTANPLFGQSIQLLGRSLGSGGANGGFSPLYQVGGPRALQLAAKLLF
jgi:hypothetical protein